MNLNDEETYMNLELIDNIKRDKGLTNKILSDKTGISLSTIDKITSGKNNNPSFNTLKALCAVLGCTYSEITGAPTNTSYPVSKKEECLIQAYRNNINLQYAVDKLLNIE